MPLFKFWKREDNTAETTTQEPATTPEVDDVLLRALLSGEPIKRNQAMTIPAVAAAVDFIANTIASMPIKLYKYKKGNVESLSDDTRVKLLNGDTGDTLDAFQMKKSFVMDYLMDGGGYIYIRKYRNDVTGLCYVPFTYVSPQILNPDPLHKNYKYFVFDEQYELFEFIKLLRNTQDPETVSRPKSGKPWKPLIKHFSTSSTPSLTAGIKRAF